MFTPFIIAVFAFVGIMKTEASMSHMNQKPASNAKSVLAETISQSVLQASKNVSSNNQITKLDLLYHCCCSYRIMNLLSVSVDHLRATTRWYHYLQARGTLSNIDSSL